MGIYLNPANDKFKEARNSEIYVDKSELSKRWFTYSRWESILSMSTRKFSYS